MKAVSCSLAPGNCDHLGWRCLPRVKGSRAQALRVVSLFGVRRPWTARRASPRLLAARRAPRPLPLSPRCAPCSQTLTLRHIGYARQSVVKQAAANNQRGLARGDIGQAGPARTITVIFQDQDLAGVCWRRGSPSARRVQRSARPPAARALAVPRTRRPCSQSLARLSALKMTLVLRVLCSPALDRQMLRRRLPAGASPLRPSRRGFLQVDVSGQARQGLRAAPRQGARRRCHCFAMLRAAAALPQSARLPQP